MSYDLVSQACAFVGDEVTYARCHGHVSSVLAAAGISAPAPWNLQSVTVCYQTNVFGNVIGIPTGTVTFLNGQSLQIPTGPDSSCTAPEYISGDLGSVNVQGTAYFSSQPTGTPVIPPQPFSFQNVKLNAPVSTTRFFTRYSVSVVYTPGNITIQLSNNA
jgi:hypothetical protein